MDARGVERSGGAQIGATSEKRTSESVAQSETPISPGRKPTAEATPTGSSRGRPCRAGNLRAWRGQALGPRLVDDVHQALALACLLAKRRRNRPRTGAACYLTRWADAMAGSPISLELTSLA